MDVVAGVDGATARARPALRRSSACSMGCIWPRSTCSTTSSARRRPTARGPTVITFDHHPDEILTGTRRRCWCDPEERLERLDEAGVAVTVVQHFDVTVRETTFDAFVERIRARASSPAC